MKSQLRLLLLALFVIFQTAAFAQYPQFNNLSIQPQNPTDQDTIQVITEVMFSSMPCDLNSQQISAGTDTVIISSHHNSGMLPTICTSHDTTEIGPLNDGVYHLIYQITDQSYTQVADYDTLTFTVGCPDPAAGFSTSLSAIDTTIHFTDNSQYADSVVWDFGDGDTSFVFSPSHQYADTGSYQVCQLLFNSCGADTLCQTVQVDCSAPQTGFSYTADDLEYQFNEQAPGAQTFLWTFGDGDSSTSSNPQHTYPDTGTYQVCLFTGNDCGQDTSCQTVDVVCPIPAAGFAYQIDTLEVNFISTSQHADSLFWDFGDQNTGNGLNPQHTYSDTGTYEVCLTAVNDCGTDTVCQSVEISCYAPIPEFTYQADSLEVTFTDQSQDAQNYLWDFGDGEQSVDQNPVHEYDSEGTYTVCLTAENACGTDSVCQTVTITCPVPSANFSFEEQGLTVIFSNLSSDADSYFWDFGDTKTSTEEDPVNEYTKGGVYQVCLTAFNQCGADTVCGEVSPLINSAGEHAEKFSDVKLYPNPAQNSINIEFENGAEQRVSEVIIRNINGAAVEVLNINNSRRELDISDRPAGFYLVEFIGSNGDRSVRTFIKQ